MFAKMLLFIDNFDSFTYNLVQYFQILGQDVRVCQNNQPTIADIQALNPQYIVIGPGPCTPSEAGISLDIIRQFAGQIPILGVCLGHQAIAQAFGAKIVKANTVMHGRTSPIYHDDTGIFQGLPSPFLATRYHSLVIDNQSLSDDWLVNAWTFEQTHKNQVDKPDFSQKTIMAIRHQSLAIEGVQFHPESILSENGLALLHNFLNKYQ